MIQLGGSPSHINFNGPFWRSLEVELIQEFDLVTASNPQLQQRYGGAIVSDARDDSDIDAPMNLTVSFRSTKLSGVLCQLLRALGDAKPFISKYLQIYLRQPDQRTENGESLLLTDKSADFSGNYVTRFDDVQVLDDVRQRILLVSYYCPTRAHAGGLRILDIYNLIRQKCPNIQLDLFTFYRPAIDWNIDELNSLFHNVYISPTEELTPDSLLMLRGTALHYDVVDLQFHQSGYQIERFRTIGRKILFTPMESMVKVAYINIKNQISSSTDSSEIDIESAFGPAVEEIDFAFKADQVVCVSIGDAALLRAITSSKKIDWIETGLSQYEFSDALAEEFICASAQSRRRNVLYVAYFGSETNVQALRWYLDKVHPIIKSCVPDYVLTVVGRGDMSVFDKYRDNSIEFAGEVAAIGSQIREAGVGIAPALSGAGFRGKINQYAVFGVPCIASSIAHAGLKYTNNVNIYIADTPNAFADRCIELLTDFGLNDRIGRAARDLCLREYTWQSRWRKIRKIYNIATGADQLRF